MHPPGWSCRTGRMRRPRITLSTWRTLNGVLRFPSAASERETSAWRRGLAPWSRARRFSQRTPRGRLRCADGARDHHRSIREALIAPFLRRRGIRPWRERHLRGWLGDDFYEGWRSRDGPRLAVVTQACVPPGRGGKGSDKNPRAAYIPMEWEDE